MIKTLLIAVVATLFAVGSGMFVRASADPEIGQPEVAERRPITNFDTRGDDSVLKNCEHGTKIFAFSVRIKAGTPGNFIRSSKSRAHLELSTGEVIRDRGYLDPAKRRLSFLLYPEEPSRTVRINRSANAFVKFTTNGATNVVVGQVSEICTAYH